MSLFICSLNSGSNGNCYYLGNDREAILVDAGISCREIEIRMKRLNLSMERIKAVFITHEHSDHINGVSVLSKKYDLPVYITSQTLKEGGIKLAERLTRSFTSLEPVEIGNLTITPLPKFHDASDPYSFTIACKEVRVGVFTDTGKPCSDLLTHFGQCNAAFLEANYDEEMLEGGRYPYFLKTRIRGGHGHLSNSQALEVFKNNRPSFMSHLILAHLSKNNNHPDLVSELFNKNADGVKIVVASRYRETELYHITNSGASAPIINKPLLRTSQLAFSFT